MKRSPPTKKLSLVEKKPKMNRKDLIVAPDDRILITGAAGFIGPRVIDALIRHGFTRLRCFVRPSSDRTRLQQVLQEYPDAQSVEIIEGNLLSGRDCDAACKDAAVVYHLATARGENSFPDVFMNSVVTTRNLLRSSVKCRTLRRFVNVSSFSVYSNRGKKRRVLDETCPVEPNPELRRDAFCFAKVKQEEIVAEFGAQYKIPFVTLRPGFVFGPGTEGIAGRVGTGGFGIFLHMGGSNQIPFTYVDNCAEAIVLAGLTNGIDGEAFNIVDDDLLTSRRFLSLYKRNVRPFSSLYIPHLLSYLLCYFWEKYSSWSEGQLPPVYNRKRWHAYWKKTRYSNEKLKSRLGWLPVVPTNIAFERYFESCRSKRKHA